MSAQEEARVVLIVDDDPIFVEVARSLICRRFEVEVVAAGDGKAAQALVGQHADRLALIVSDLNMPDFDGVELICAWAREGLKVPVLVVTGAADAIAKGSQVLAQAVGLPLVGVLRKPVQPSVMLAHLEPILSRWAAGDARG